MGYDWPLAEDAMLSPCQLAEMEYEFRSSHGSRGAVRRLGGTTQPFQRGNADTAGGINVTDAMNVLGGLFLAGSELPCQDAADVNDSGTLELTDAIHLLGYLFLGQAPPAAPFIECGLDATPDALSCVAAEGCEY